MTKIKEPKQGKTITHKTEFFPSNEQKEVISKFFKLRRIIYNLALREVYKKYTPSYRIDKTTGEIYVTKQGKFIVNGRDFKAKKQLSLKMFTEIRDSFRSNPKLYRFTKLFSGPALNRVILNDLKEAFFGIYGYRKFGLPKPRRTKKNTFAIERQLTSTFAYESKRLKMPKIGFLQLAEELRFPFDDNIKLVTVKEECGKYYISITMDKVVIEQYEKTGLECGIDWGIKTWLTVCDTSNDKNPIYEINANKDRLLRKELRIKQYNKKLARKIKNSKNFKKCKNKLNQAYKRKWQYAKDTCHKVTSALVETYDKITIEDFKMKFMTSGNLAKKAYEGLYYTFKTQLEYKCTLRGKELILASSKFPSTQTCAGCGNVLTKENKLKLSQRVYQCKACGFSLGRDKNAALNLLMYKDLHSENYKAKP